MEFQVLGPVDARTSDGSLPIGGPKQRLLLAMLLLHRGEAVDSARLADGLWGDAPPPSAAKTVQVFVARLRKALGEGVVVTRQGGYALDVPAAAVDAARFESLVEQGRAALATGEPAAARGLLDRALALWHGPAFGDLAEEPALRVEAQRLEALRLVAVEARTDADLALGAHAQIIPELEALIAREPLRERPYGQLMLALYRSGRQADALAAYQSARRTLDEELGLRPGPELRELEQRILDQDASLAAPASTNGRPPTAGRRRRRRIHVLAAAVLAVAVVGGAAIVLLDSSDEPRAVAVRPDSVAVIDPASARVVGSIAVGGSPVAIAHGVGGVWVASAQEQTLERIDARTRRVRGRIGLGRLPTAIAAGEGAVWVASAVGPRGTVSRVEPGSASVTATRVVRGHGDVEDFAPQTPSAIAAAYGSVWSNRGRSELVVAPPGDERASTVRLAPDHSIDGIAAGAGALWMTSSADDRVLRVNPRSRRVTAAIPIASRPGARVAGPYGIAYGAGSVWVTNALSGTVSRIDPRMLSVTATIPVGRRPTSVAVGGGAVWVLNADDRTVAKIDPAANRVSASVRVGPGTGIAAGGGAVWVTVAGGTARGDRPAPGAFAPVRAATCGAPMGVTRDGALLIASDLPTWLGSRRAPVVRDMRRAIEIVLEDRRYRAGRHRIAYQACDDSRRSEGYSSPERCASNARAYASTPSLVGVVGTYHSMCSMIALPTLNAAPGGPVALVSPSNTYAGLTRAGPSTAADEPDRFFPTRIRTFARTVMPDHGQGPALAVFARELGARRLYLLDDADGTGYAMTRYTARAARRLGMAVVGSASWPPRPDAMGPIADRVAAARPDAVVLAGCFCTGGYEMLAALRSRLPRPTRYLASDAMMAPALDFPKPHPAADGLYISSAGTAAEAATAAGRRLLRRIDPDRPATGFEGYVLEAASATEVLLDAIARSDGSRASVVNALRRTTVQGGIAGELALDDAGDPLEGRFTIVRLSRDAPTHPDREMAGAVFERLVTPPAALTRR